MLLLNQSIKTHGVNQYMLKLFGKDLRSFDQTTLEKFGYKVQNNTIDNQFLQIQVQGGKIDEKNQYPVVVESIKRLKSITEVTIQYDDDFVVVFENISGEKKYYKPEKKY